MGLENADAIRHPSVMPQSLSAVYIHLVFSTKDRRPLLRDKPTRDALHSYLGGVSKQLDCPPILTQAEWVKELKRVSKGVAAGGDMGDDGGRTHTMRLGLNGCRREKCRNRVAVEFISES